MGDVKFDDLLMTLASQHDGVLSLLKTFCSFLHRKTDFYVVDESPRRPMGFAPGDAERILLAAFRSMPYKDAAGRPMMDFGIDRSSKAEMPVTAGTAVAMKRLQADNAPPLPRAIDQLHVSGQPARSASASEQEARSGQSLPALDPSTNGERTVAPPVPAPQLPSSSVSLRSSPYTIVQHTGEGKQIPISNGGVGPGYWWAQTLSDVTVSAALPAGTSSKDVQCVVSAGKLRLALKGRDTPIIDGPLYAGVRYTEAIWNLEGSPDTVRRPVDVRPDAACAPRGCGAVDVPLTDVVGEHACTGTGQQLCVFTLSLEKVVPTWWLRIIASNEHPSIDGTMVDSTQSISSYDEDTQAAIRKVMWDQAQKARGLPTSEELEQARLMEMARNAPGSPFQVEPDLSGV